MTTPKLTIELVPKTCWYSNVRTQLPEEQWNIIRKIAYKESNHKCKICTGSGLDQGFKHPVECHEEWEYNDVDKVQTLVGLAAICPKCHQVKHIGRTMLMGRGVEAMLHLSQVNDWNDSETNNYVNESFGIFNERSEHDWKLNVTILHERYGVPMDLIEEAHKR
jgi:hypothetical protein